MACSMTKNPGQIIIKAATCGAIVFGGGTLLIAICFNLNIAMGIVFIPMLVLSLIPGYLYAHFPLHDPSHSFLLGLKGVPFMTLANAAFGAAIFAISAALWRLLTKTPKVNAGSDIDSNNKAG